jgi:hypothetical protein
MKWQCSQVDRAKQIGCTNVGDDGRCTRQEWVGVTHYKKKKTDASSKAEVYCERIKTMLKEC